MLLDLLDKLVDRLIQLSQYRKQSRQALLQDHIAPLFAAFEAVHQQYLSSFAGYREALRTTPEPLTATHPILDRIRTDNLFSQHERERIVQFGKAIPDAAVAPLIAAIYDYLVDVRVAADPIAPYRGKRFLNPQHWRRTLLTELEAILADHWQPVLDPNASRPPLFGSELADALVAARRDAGISEGDPDKDRKTKVIFALRAIDEVIHEMQEAYSRIAAEYGRLKLALSRGDALL